VLQVPQPNKKGKEPFHLAVIKSRTRETCKAQGEKASQGKKTRDNTQTTNVMLALNTKKGLAREKKSLCEGDKKTEKRGGLPKQGTLQDCQQKKNHTPEDPEGGGAPPMRVEFGHSNDESGKKAKKKERISIEKNSSPRFKQRKGKSTTEKKKTQG